MADPQSELIINAVLAALQAINASAGYYTTPQSVNRYDREDDSSVGRPAIRIYKNAEAKNLRGATWDCDLTVEIEGLIDPEEDAIDGQLTDRLIALLGDDIEKALTTVDWGSLHAVFNRMDSISTITDNPNDPEDGLRITLRINYGHDVNDTRAALAI